MNTTPYPLDFDALKKGDRIAAETIKRITGKEPGSDEYNFGRLRLRQQIQDEIEERRGETVTVKNNGDGLVILTDTEATEHNHRQFKTNIRALHERHFRMMGVDREQLDGETIAKHDRRIGSQAAVILALNNSPVRFAHRPIQRQLPGAIAKETE